LPVSCTAPVVKNGSGVENAPTVIATPEAA